MQIRSDTVWLLALALFAVGGALVALGSFLQIDALAALGLMLFAAGPICIGLHAVSTRHLVLYTWHRYTREKFYGLNAVAMGTVFLISGTLILFAALAQMLGYPLAALAENKGGLILAGLGLIAILAGIAQIGMSVMVNNRKLPLFWTWQYKLSGALAILLGVVTVVAGLLNAFSPGTYRAVRRAAFESLLSILKRL